MSHGQSFSISLGSLANGGRGFVKVPRTSSEYPERCDTILEYNERFDAILVTAISTICCTHYSLTGGRNQRARAVHSSTLCRDLGTELGLLTVLTYGERT